jgi:FeS assembly protein IscX
VAQEILWTDAEEIGIQLAEKYPDVDPLSVRFTDLHKYVIELEGFADDPSKSNESRLEAIQMAWHEEFKDLQDSQG